MWHKDGMRLLLQKYKSYRLERIWSWHRSLFSTAQIFRVLDDVDDNFELA